MNFKQPRLHPTYAALLRARALIADGIASEIADDHLMALLFLKFISDQWQDKYEQTKATPGCDPRRLQAMMDNERFIIPPEAHFNTLHQQRHAPGCAGRIDQALGAVAHANREKLRGIFQNIGFEHNMLDGGADGQHLARQAERLEKLLESFAEPALNFRAGGSAQDGGATADFLLRHFAAKRGRTGRLAPTAPAVAELLARLADPQQRDQICDPACGIGTLLLACANLQRARHGHAHLALFGQESDRATWAAARMNLLMHGDDNHLLEHGDTLRHPGLLTPGDKLRQFDLQLCALPFSPANWGKDDAQPDRFNRFRRGLPPANWGGYAFLSHMAACMKPETGRMVALCTPGMLIREGEEGQIRRRLLEDNLVDAVITLPPNLLPGLRRHAAILLLRMGKKDGTVLFVDGGGIPRTTGAAETIERIVDAVAARVDVDGLARLADMGGIEGQAFKLSVGIMSRGMPRRLSA